MAEVSQNVIDKIMKCLSLADSKDYNPNEAENALRAAKRLADQYGLDFAEIEAAKQNKKAEEIEYKFEHGIDEKIRRFHDFEKELMHAIDSLFGIRHCYAVYRGRGWCLTIIGIKQDVVISRMAFDILRKTCMRMARGVYGQQQWGAMHRSFAMGFAHSIVERAAKIAREKNPVGESNSRALVVVNKETQLDKHMKGLGLKDRKNRQRSELDYEAVMEGVSAGKNVNLNFKSAIA